MSNSLPIWLGCYPIHCTQGGLQRGRMEAREKIPRRKKTGSRTDPGRAFNSRHAFHSLGQVRPSHRSHDPRIRDAKSQSRFSRCIKRYRPRRHYRGSTGPQRGDSNPSQPWARKRRPSSNGSRTSPYRRCGQYADLAVHEPTPLASQAGVGACGAVELANGRGRAGHDMMHGSRSVDTAGMALRRGTMASFLKARCMASLVTDGVPLRRALMSLEDAMRG